MDVQTLLLLLPLGSALFAAGCWLLVNQLREIRRARQAALGPEERPVPAPRVVVEQGGKHWAGHERALPVADLLARDGAPIRIIWPVRHAESDTMSTVQLPQLPGNLPEQAPRLSSGDP